MKRYSQSKSHRGKVAYRTPSTFRYRKHLSNVRKKSQMKTP